MLWKHIVMFNMWLQDRPYQYEEHLFIKEVYRMGPSWGGVGVKKNENTLIRISSRSTRLYAIITGHLYIQY